MKKYQIIKQIGEGSFATAWLAQDASGNGVVLKKYKSAETAQARREFIFLSTLQQANVPRFIEYSSSPENLFLAMEYISGNSPAQADFSTPLELDTFFFQLCNQIVTIQAAGIVLNDLKPDNIIIRNQTPWLLDLGLATTNNYNDGRFRGNIAYSSPEKIRHNVSNFAGDIFALGILYYYLSQGKHPADLITRDWQTLLLNEDAWNQWLTQQQFLPDFILKMLSYYPARRPSVVQALQHFASLAGVIPALNRSIIADYLFPSQQEMASQLFQRKNIIINPDDEPYKIINQIMLLSEASGKPACLINDRDLTSSPDAILAQFQSLSDIDLQNITDLTEFPTDIANIILIRNEQNSPFFQQMLNRPDTYSLVIDNSFPAHLLSDSEYSSYLLATAAHLDTPLDNASISIASARLWLRFRLLPETAARHTDLIALSAAINHPIPLSLAEFLEPDWLSQITAALQTGSITLTASEFFADSFNMSPLPDDILQNYQAIAEQQEFHLYAALIAILRKDNAAALQQTNLQYRIFTQKGYFTSAWQVITLLETRLGWQNLDFNLQKAKAFLARKLGDPATAISLYQQLVPQPQGSQAAIIAADLAIAFQENGQLDDALNAHQQALEFFRSDKNTKAVLRCLNNIAAVHYLKNDYNQSSQIYLEMIRLAEDNESSEFARNYHLIAEINLADIFLHKAQWKRALSYARNAAQNAVSIQLPIFRYQAEFIAISARFALGENDELTTIIEQFLTDKYLLQNPVLLHELSANALIILQFLDPPQAQQLADNLLQKNLNEYPPNLLLSLFYYGWQNRKMQHIHLIPALLPDGHYRKIADSLLNPDSIQKTLQRLSRQDDCLLYINYATQIAAAGLTLENKAYAAEIDKLLTIYSFQPLAKIIQNSTSTTPEHLQLLWDVVSLIHDKVDFSQIMAALLSGIIRIARLDRAVFFAWQEGKLVPMQGLDKNLAALDLESIQVSQTILLETLEKKEINFLTDLQSETDFDIHSSIFGLGLRSAVCYPLILQDNIHGVIYSDAQSNRNFDDQEKMLLTSILVQGRSAFEKAVLIQNIRRQQLDKLIENDQKFDDSIIGNSPAMQKIFHLINLVSSHNVNVLITGATGTGKELVARAVHKRYAPDKPFTPLNCAAIPENLLESELFGYVKGAFTGADRDKTGLIEATRGGTLFLDEIGDMPPALQAKLLRVIQERQLTPVGSNKIIPVDVRIIAATNRSLEKAIENGSFRQDLYYRLKVIKIDLPSLAKRREDIPLLVQHFITRYNERFHKEVKGISAPALQLLQNKEWQGNIRELENDIERAMVLCQDTQLTLDLFEGSALQKNYSLEDNIPLNWDDYKEYRRQFTGNLDEIYAKKLLKAANNKISSASRLAKISRTQIYRLLNPSES
ncbi:MAG: sigma 54-interacting transcriptional regulator [Candidatus Cloacimonetes bacterium]|nr:sigma 54-interacting transcriptional regulator [Candidatus Cloacimonadota bacterium]